MNYRKTTRTLLWTFLALFLGMAAYDLLPAFSPARGDTISEVMAEVARAHPLVPFLIGGAVFGLAAHFWWANPAWVKRKEEEDGDAQG